MHWWWRGLFVTLGAACAAGCGNPSSTSQLAAPTATAESGDAAAVKRYAAKDLPSVGDPLPSLDEGRVELMPPKEWRILAYDSKYLARFVKGNEINSLPRITVSVPVPAPPGVQDVTKANAVAFAAKMQKRAEGVKGRRMLEPARPIILGDIAWSRHVRYVRTTSGHAAVQALETARGGRLYIIELTVAAKEDNQAAFSKAILEYRDVAYAVAANWKFTGEAPAPAAESAAAESSAKVAPDDSAKSTAENRLPVTEPGAKKQE